MLDDYPDVLEPIAKELINKNSSETGRKALSVDGVFRCLRLKQLLRVSYEELSFVLSDSQTYRTFARLGVNSYTSKSTLQENIRRPWPVALVTVFESLAQQGHDMGTFTMDTVRIDSTVVKSILHLPVWKTIRY